MRYRLTRYEYILQADWVESQQFKKTQPAIQFDPPNLLIYKYHINLGWARAEQFRQFGPIERDIALALDTSITLHIFYCNGEAFGKKLPN